MQYFWNHNRRFNAFSNYCIKKFGTRVQKLSIRAGFTCPNRDGTLSFSGCSYCNNDAFNPSYCHLDKSVSTQISEGISFHSVRYRRASKYLAYFQAYSNTYAEVAKLKKLYEEALQVPDVIGLSIGTRPDCIDDEKLDYLQKLNETKFISLEFGVESCYDKTLLRINRGHTFEQSINAIKKTADRGIHTGVHIIFGLPGEDKNQMMAQAKVLSALPINSIKFHQLQFIKDTAILKDFENNQKNFISFSLNDYIDFVIDFIEELNPAICIERFTAEVPPRFLIGTTWGLYRTDQILQMIEKRLEERNTYQGRKINT